MSIFRLFILGKHTLVSSPSLTPTGNNYPALRLLSRSYWWVSKIGKGFLQVIKYKQHSGKWELEPCSSAWQYFDRRTHRVFRSYSYQLSTRLIIAPPPWQHERAASEILDNHNPSKGLPEVVIPIPTVTLNMNQYRKLSMSALLSLDPKSRHVFVGSLFSQVNSTSETRLFIRLYPLAIKHKKNFWWRQNHNFLHWVCIPIVMLCSKY